MKQRKDIVRHASEVFDMPEDLFPGTPLVELYGNHRILIENHRGVAGYSCREISVCTQLGTYLISGNKLEIVNMTKHRLVITGTILSVTLNYRR